MEQKAAAPPEAGTPRADKLRQEAGGLRRQAQDARESAEALKREAEALAKAAEAAQHEPPRPGESPPADPTLPGRLKEAAQKLGRNEVGQARQAQEAAARMLKSMQDALQERADPEGDRLAKMKKLQAAEQELEQLVEDQERLQKKAQEAHQIADPAQRKQELEHLAREQ